MQMKFYSPLTADFFPNDTEDLDDDYSEYEGIPYTGKELTGYRDVIRDAIYEDVKDFYGDLMRYYREDDSVRRKVVRAIPTVDEVNGELVGSLWVDTDAPLTAEEQAVFCAYIPVSTATAGARALSSGKSMLGTASCMSISGRITILN